MKNDFMMAINQVCHERQLALDIVLEAVEVALTSAYKRNFSGSRSITAQIDSNSGEPLIFVEMVIVDQIEDEESGVTYDKLFHSLSALIQPSVRGTGDE